MQTKKFKTRAIIFIFVLLLLCVLLIHEFPILKYYITKENAYENVTLVILHGKTVFKEKGNFFVNLPEDTENLIVVGDIFDKMEAENNISKPFCTALGFINNSPQDVYFTVGTPVHDPEFLAGPDFSNYEITCNKSTIHIAGRLAVFEIDGLNVAAHHGDYIADGFMNCAISYFSKKLGNPLILERLWKEAVALDEDYWLVAGHSHIPSIDYEHKTANPGGWNPVPVIGGDLKNAVIVEQGNVTLVKLK